METRPKGGRVTDKVSRFPPKSASFPPGHGPERALPAFPDATAVAGRSCSTGTHGIRRWTSRRPFPVPAGTRGWAARERPRWDLPVVQRRIAEIIIDFLQRKRSLPLQQVNDVQALFQFGHTPRSLVPTTIVKYSDIFRPSLELHETAKKATFVKTRKP